MSEELDVLRDKAIDIVFLNGMLVRVTIVPADESTSSCDLFMLSSATVSELKVSVSEHCDLDPAELRLSTNNAPFLSGTLDQVGEAEFAVSLTHVPVDPLRESLLALAGYVDWKEQDECMGRMLTHRLPEHCFCGLDASQIPEIGDTGYERTCAQCKYSFWSEADLGWTPPLDLDPYAMLLDVTLQSSKRFARMACFSSSTSQLRTRGRSPFLSNARRETIYNRAETKIVHDGAHLILRFQDCTSSLLEGTSRENELAQLEKNEFMEHGAGVDEIRNWTYAILESSLWSALRDAGAKKHPPRTELRIKLASFGINEVIFEAMMGPEQIWNCA